MKEKAEESPKRKRGRPALGTRPMTDAERASLSRNKRSLARAALQREQADREFANAILAKQPTPEQIEEQAVMDRWTEAFARHREAITTFIKHAAIRPGNSNIIPMDVVNEISAAEEELKKAQAEIDRITQEIRTGKRR